MRRLLFPLALLLASACSSAPAKTELDPAADPARYRRVGVLPFSDRLGMGHRFAELVGRGLFKLDFDVSDMRSIETVFQRLQIDYSGGLSLQDLAEIRHATYVDAIIFGTIDSAPSSVDGSPRFKKAALLMLDAENGDVVLRTEYEPRGRTDPRDVEGIAEMLLRSMKKELDARRAGVVRNQAPEEIP